MINIKDYVVAALKQTGYTVNYFYPQNFIKLPIITYSEINNSTLVSHNNKDLLCDVTYEINIWNNDTTTEIATEVDEKMLELGFKRITSLDLYEQDTDIHHKKMRYRGQISDKLYMYNN